ncbi:MAG: hypothetical protein ILP09_08715 [Oscillospiraceae bacterium]|nr:hypothetical protein [Oscillospiraceae bacterium]
MKIRLIRDARIRHKAGEIVEVSPAEANFLLSLNSAVVFEEVKEAPKKKAKK